jgi:predicted acetyltransferase
MKNVRNLYPDELEKLARLYRNAYRIDAATAQKWLRDIKPENTYVIADEQRVLSAIQILPFRVVIGGKPLPMGGIGGVATWADQQGYGYAGTLMSASIPRMRELGYAVSFLYPFSYRYYGKFGWALSARRCVYTNISPRDLPRRKEPPRVKAVSSAVDWSRASAAYSLGYQIYNCLVERGEREWFIQRRKCDEERYHVYYIENEAGEVRGHFSCEETPLSSYSYETIVRDLVCADRGAYEEFFAFLATLPTNVGKVTIGHPEQPWLWQYFKEPFIETRIDPYFQARVVDVEKACTMRGYSQDEEVEISFLLHDPFAPWNEGTWHLRIKSGSGFIERTSRPPDCEMTVQQFSALYTGFLDPLEQLREGQLICRDEKVAEKLARIFHDRPVSLLDFF